MIEEKSFDQHLAEILQDYRNQDATIDLSRGSLMLIRAVALASALWGAHRERVRISRQIFPDTADPENLEHHCAVRSIFRLSGENSSALLGRLLDVLRRPPAGGNAHDYEVWARSIEIVAGAPDSLESVFLEGPGLGNFSAANLVDGSVVTKGFDVDSAVAGARLVCLAGYSRGYRNYTGIKVYMSASGSTAVFKIRYSDNEADFTDVVASFNPSAAGWNEVAWDSVGSHLVWDLELQNAPGAGPDVMEVQFLCGAEIVDNAICFPLALGTGTVDVLIMSSIGNGVPSGSMLQRVYDYIDSVRPVTSHTFRVLGPILQTVNVSITGSGNFNRSVAEAEISAYMNTLLPAETLYLSKLVSIVIQAGASNAIVSLPATDVVPSGYQMVRPGTVEVV